MISGGLWNRLNYVRRTKKALQNEKNLSEQLLLNILPEEIADELKEKGEAKARSFENVSILFSDFKSFTEQAEKLGAAELVSEINYCFTVFDKIMEKYGVEKIKTIGDSYMAAGGLPIPSDNAVIQTVLAGLEMQAFINRRRVVMNAKGRTSFEMRVGIHTGPVIAGIVGTKKFQYDVWGDTVNTASRMESQGSTSEVNISKSTYDLIKESPIFEFVNRGKIYAKGKGDVDMYFVSWSTNFRKEKLQKQAAEHILNRLKT